MVLKCGNCLSCVFWRQGASPNTEHAAPAESDHELGVCEVMSPQDFILPNGSFVSRQPVTHSTRSCAMWEPGTGGDDSEPDPDPDDGERLPAPARNKVRNLFPIQPAPLAA